MSTTNDYVKPELMARQGIRYWVNMPRTMLDHKIKCGCLREAVMAFIVVHCIGHEFQNHYARRYGKAEWEDVCQRARTLGKPKPDESENILRQVDIARGVAKLRGIKPKVVGEEPQLHEGDLSDLIGALQAGGELLIPDGDCSITNWVVENGRPRITTGNKPLPLPAGALYPVPDPGCTALHPQKVRVLANFLEGDPELSISYESDLQALETFRKERLARIAKIRRRVEASFCQKKAQLQTLYEAKAQEKKARRTANLSEPEFAAPSESTDIRRTFDAQNPGVPRTNSRDNLIIQEAPIQLPREGPSSSPDLPSSSSFQAEDDEVALVESAPPEAAGKVVDSDYATFKSLYPHNRFDEPKAKPAFELKPAHERQLVIQHLRVYLVSERWARSQKEDNGRYIPLASNWIRTYDAEPPPYFQAGASKQGEDLEQMAAMTRALMRRGTTS